MTLIDNVHVIFKTHLDIGFTDFSRSVVRRYVESFIPQALALAKRLREETGERRFVWTTGSWLIDHYLENTSAAKRRVMEAAIEEGDIVWHGLPFTTHSELMDASLFQFGLSIARKLDRRFGRRTIAAKMTDVPGHTRGIVPLMADAGLEFLHIGVNPGSAVPDVPPVFVWRDEASGHEIVVMYHPNYGEMTIVPGLSDVVAITLTGDNLGPPSPQVINDLYARLYDQFPQAVVAPSTLDAYAERLLTVKQTLPVVTGEIGDSWIHGVGSDPAKVAAFKALARKRRDWIEAGRLPDQAAFERFSERLLMIAEHTWGLDQKTHLRDYTYYAGEAFAGARQQPMFQKMEQSWGEQRAYLDQALNAIAGTPFAGEAAQAVAATRPAPAITGGFDRIDPSLDFQTAHFDLRFDPASGAVVRLVERATGRQWANATNPFGVARYEAFSQAEYERFWINYIRNKDDPEVQSWAVYDYLKPGIEAFIDRHVVVQPVLRDLYHRFDGGDHRFVLLLETEQPVYGCPKRWEIEITLPESEARVDYALRWFEKPACRLPEAIWFALTPAGVDPREWRLVKLGSVISPFDVVRNGGHKLHAAERAFCGSPEQPWLSLESHDAPLVAFGRSALLNFDNAPPEGELYFNLLNNIWATNFPLWYDEDASFRFTLTLASQSLG